MDVPVLILLLALISGVIGVFISWITLNRKQKREAGLSSIEKKIIAQNEAMKYVLYDRIRFLGQAYIDAGEIDFDDRILNNMHHSYHFGLGGNGDLDTLMNEVNHLPLKKHEKE